ncbi:DNA-directed DNA/RNA polymerase mu isoform X2 [Elgaria multicarinata webbii]|uniref:DNA-directed DNA/RNA polymerase mu isoform X2 n=1 Tax=Elgaria multicarinata webbii TaxID=159646 RepID=UPI002FCCFDC8
MLPHPVKKKRPREPKPTPPADPGHPVRFPEVVLCLVEKRMGATRKAFLTTLARSKGFCVEDAKSERVTHVVSEGNSGDEVVKWLKRNGNCYMDAVGSGPALLDLSWFTESMSAGRPVEIKRKHCLEVTAHAEKLEGDSQVAAYACQRRTPLTHNNAALTEALETMAEEAHFCGSEVRSLGFTRAASVLKALSWAVRRVQELSGLPCIGEHSKRIIQLFTKIFGVGVKTASRWYQEGLRTLADLQVHRTKLNKEQQAGLLHYKDLNTPVERPEAEAIAQVVQEVAEQLLPGASVTLIGGFRRGKRSGHDVDLLITHPAEGQEAGLLSKIIGWLESQDFLLYHSSRRNTFQYFEEEEEQEISSSASGMDRFERCLSIFRLGNCPGAVQGGAGAQKPGASGSWKAIRVDFVVAPCSQFPFALLGWTGSKNFERDLRRFSKQEKKMTLNSHSLYHMEQKTFLSAASEEEIFQHLGLEYIPPEERNA